MVKHFGVTPYLVFDGDFLPSKARTEASRAKRREDSRKAGLELLKAGKPSQAHLELQKAIDVTPEMARQLIEELKKENIPYVVAPYEADAQLVYLERHGFTSGSISEDSDLLVFGAKRLLTKMDQYGQCVEINRRDFCGVREISLTGWTDDQFRQMAIFSGCDYLDSIGNMGLKTAYRMMRKHKTPERVIRMLQFDGKFRVSENYLAQYKQAELTFLHQRVFCPERQEVILLTEPQPSSALDIEEMPYIGARVDPKLAKAIASGDINPITKQPITVAILPDKRRSTNGPRLVVTATSGLGRPAPGKPIDEHFKDQRRIPMGEMDRNCFAVESERVAALTQNGLTPRVFPLPRPYLDDTDASQPLRPYTGRTVQRRRTEPISRTLRSLDSSFDSAAPRRHTVGDGRRVSDADPRPLKKARLCEDDPSKDGAELVTERSKFFPRYERSEEFNFMSDDSIEEALAKLPDIGGEWVDSRTSGPRQTLQIFQDETATEMADDDPETKNDTDAGDQPAIERQIEADRIQDQSKNNTEGDAPGRTLRGVLDEFAYTPNKPKEVGSETRMAFGLPTPASSVQMSQPRQVALTPTETSLQTPLQRIGMTALQKRTSSSPVSKAKSLSRKRSSLAESLERFPINPAFVPLPNVDLAEVEALNNSGGSEDQILPDSDEENDPPASVAETKHRASRRLDLSMFLYA